MAKPSNAYMESFAKASISRTLRKYNWLPALTRKHKLQPILMQNIMEFLDEIVHTRNEGEKLNVGLVFKNKNLKLQQAPIKSDGFHIRSTSKFSMLKNIVSGSVLCYVVDDKGMATIERIPSNLWRETSNLTLQNVSRIYQTIVFCVRMSTVEIYESGNLIRICRKGIWTKPCSMPLEELEAKGFPMDLLRSIMGWCITLSERGTGCVFVVTRDNSSSYCSPLAKGYSFVKCKISQLPESQIIEYASLDGAIIVNTKKEILCIGQKLEAPSSAKYREAGRGTRHNSAANYSAAVDSVVFVVSEDGPISLFFEGDVFSRCFEELFGA
jgi:hypothetical protein